MDEDPKYLSLKASIESATCISRESGVRHFNPREMGSPLEHTQDEIDAYSQRLEEEERAFIEAEARPRQSWRLKCDRCREEEFGLCDEHAKMLRQHDWADVHPDNAWDMAASQMQAMPDEYVITSPCMNPAHGPGSTRWVTVYSCETKRDEGRCNCRDRSVSKNRK